MLNESGILTTIEKEIDMDEHGKGINIEHHDHDYHPKGYGDYGHAGGWGIFGVVGFIAFIVILWGVWAAHNRNSDHFRETHDKHNDTLRCLDKLGYELGYTRKQLNEIEAKEVAIIRGEEKIYDRQCKEFEESLRFGMPYGEHTQKLCTARPQYCGSPERPSYRGGVYNGTQVSETNTNAYDRTVMI